QSLAFIEELAGLVNAREEQPLQDLVRAELALRDPHLGGGLLDDAGHLRVGVRGAVARLVAVPTLAVLLAEPAGLDDAVGDRHLAVIRVLLGAALPGVVAD